MPNNEAVAAKFLDALAADDRAELIDATREVRVERGSALFHQGEPGDRFAVLITGRVKIVTRYDTGRAVLAGLRGTGELVGEIAILDQEPRGADVIAIDPLVVRIGTAETFRRCVLAKPAALVVLARSLASRLRESDRGRTEAAALDGNARVAVRLLDMAARYGAPAPDGVRIDLPITQDELADWTGSSRPVVARALAELRAAGLVATARRAVAVIDPSGLQAYVADRV